MKVDPRHLSRSGGALVCLLLAAGAAPAPAEPTSPAAPVLTAEHQLPRAPAPLHVHTEDRAPIVSKDDYVPGTLVFRGARRAVEIKGRGNSTWAWPKKPYKIRLSKDAALLNGERYDEWVLLAGYADRSALRTHLAMRLAASTRLAWTPRTRFVDVVLNGVPQGLYLLTDQVEQGTGRVDLPEGGFLLEVDARFRDQREPGFWSDHGIPVSFKDPDEPTRRERRLVRNGVSRFERALYGRNFADRRLGYRKHVELDTFVDWYLVQELFRNEDSNFFSSVHVTWTPGGKIALGPVWDFDLSAGTRWKGVAGPEGYYSRDGSHWVNRMLQDPAFTELVHARWTRLRPQVEAMIADIPAAANVIRSSALQDWDIWPTATAPELVGSVHADTFDGEVAYLADWLTARAAWMDEDQVLFGVPSSDHDEQAQVVTVRVEVLGESVRPIQVDYSWGGGSATLGTDFAMADGTLTFGPGERAKSFPVTILDDHVPERRETVELRLHVATADAELSAPSTVTLAIRRSDLAQRDRSAGRTSEP